SGSVFLNARTYIEAHDRDALILPFAGRLSQDEGKASSFDGGAHAIIERTIEDCKIGHFYTANKDLVAAWAFKLGLTVEEAIRLVNATLEPHVTLVEAVSMRAVVEAGSVEKARSLGMTRRLGFEDGVDDGDLLLLTPGVLGEGKEGEFCGAI
ncbi:obg-like ATPase 1-like protein, partial [Aphelenchoides avenae]